VGEYDLALLDYNRSLQLDSTSASTYLNRGITYYHKSLYQSAILDFNQAITLAPDDPAAYGWRGSAYLNSGGTDDQIRDDFCRHVQLAGADADPVVTDAIKQHGWQCPA